MCGVIDGVTNAKKTANSLTSLPDSKSEASLTVGVSSAWSSSENHSSTAVLSGLTAGRGMTLTTGQDLSMQGTQAQAGRDMTLVAVHDLTIHAAESSSGVSSTSGKVSASVRIGATAGTGGVSFGYKENLGLSGAVEASDAHFCQSAKILAGANLTTISGQDTAIAGANLTGKDVSMTVGRNLNMSSLQHSSSYSSGRYDIKAGATVTVCNNPGQSLGMLNRDPNNTMQTNSSQDYSITVSPLFDKISDSLGLYGYPAKLNKAAFWLTDPKGAWSGTNYNSNESLVFLNKIQLAAQPQPCTQH